MYQNVKIESLDHFGRGIAHINNKVIFIKNALPEEIVDIKITVEKKNFSEGYVVNYIKKSAKRIDNFCKFCETCGGCSLSNLSYQDTINFKKNKIIELLNKNKIDYNKEIEVIKNPHPISYRNKITLKIINGQIGYYESKSHKLVAIDECHIANKEINKVIKNYELLGIHEGNLTIRANSNNEILLIIDSLEKKHNIELMKLKEIIKLVGIVYNKKAIYGDNFLYERIGGYLFKISFDAFFQINPYICVELFNIISKETAYNSKVLDLYSGVGTLGIVASSKAKEVLSIEIIPNAVVNGIFNAKINKKENIKFILGDVATKVNKTNFIFDTLIVDPPRKGLDKNTIKFIKDKKPNKIIYISCDAVTLMRDLKNLENLYEIKNYKILDMFSYSYHIENICILHKRNFN